MRFSVEFGVRGFLKDERRKNIHWRIDYNGIRMRCDFPKETNEIECLYSDKIIATNLIRSGCQW